jgi:[acyl-carrier-protein] S-malonyltransferase
MNTTNPSPSRALVFSGFGNHRDGMGIDLRAAYPEARRVFEETDAVLKFNLSNLIFYGPKETLRLPQHMQPALVAMSRAVVHVLEARMDLWGESTRYVAGHSFGEYSALYLAGGVNLQSILDLFRANARALEDPVAKSGMMAVLMADKVPIETVFAIVQRASRDGQPCVMANNNAPNQIVISGHREAVKRAIALAEREHSWTALAMHRGIPAHSPLMQPLADRVHPILTNMAIAKPRVPIVDYGTIKSVSDPETIRRNLIANLVGPVYWREAVIHMRDDLGVTQFIECGTAVLSVILKMNDPKINAVPLCTVDGIEAFLRQEASAKGSAYALS